MITTSREPLQVLGEHVVPVAPLELPARRRNGNARSTGAERSGDAVYRSGPQRIRHLRSDRLESRRGRYSSAGGSTAFRWRSSSPQSRTRVLTAQQILERLTDRFVLLTGGSRAALPRHQTLRTTIDWSHDLLRRRRTSPLQTFIRIRRPVQPGRYRVGLCLRRPPAPEVLALLTSLVDKSLVTKEDVKRCCALPAPRDDARICRPQAAGCARGGRSRGAMPRVLPDEVSPICGPGPLSASRVAWWTELEIDNIRLFLSYACSRRLCSRARHRRLDRLLLDHARNH